MYKPGVDSVVAIRTLDRAKARPLTQLPQRIKVKAPPTRAASFPAPRGVGTPPQPPWVGPGPMPGPQGPPGTIGDIDYSMLPPELAYVPISFPFGGKPATGGMVNLPMAFALTVPVNLVGTRVYATTPASGNPVFVVNKIKSGALTELGTITIMSGDSIIGPPGDIISVFHGPGGALDVGDVLQVVAPTQDATLADVGITILTMRV